MIAVKAIQDYDSHWYLVPNELVEDFHRLVKNESDQDEFIDKFEKYRTGGDVNGEQLYIED